MPASSSAALQSDSPMRNTSHPKSATALDRAVSSGRFSLCANASAFTIWTAACWSRPSRRCSRSALSGSAPSESVLRLSTGTPSFDAHFTHELPPADARRTVHVEHELAIAGVGCQPMLGEAHETARPDRGRRRVPQPAGAAAAVAPRRCRAGTHRSAGPAPRTGRARSIPTDWSDRRCGAAGRSAATGRRLKDAPGSAI